MNTTDKKETRSELLETIEHLYAIILRLERDNADLSDNLTSVQARCSELLEEVRGLRRAGHGG